jgi:2-phospho-L-lactate guanylyltransferase (CobY/MobA/RfbA family)
MAAEVSLIVFEGGLVGGKLEEQMQLVRRGIVLDLIAKARGAGYGRIIVVTSYSELERELQAAGVEVLLDSGEQPFHFGKHLLAVVQHYRLEKVLYMGGAAAPLISTSELEYIRDILEKNENALLANNYYSADIVGFTPGDTLTKITPPPIDNTLAMGLSSEGGLRWIPVQRTLGLNFDVDTPADVLILSDHPDAGPNTRAAVAELNWEVDRYAEIKDLLMDPTGELIIFGRVGSNLFQYLDSNTRCRLRLFSEERGMKALGRDARGEVRSLMGRFIEELGYEEFFRFLGEIARGAVLDSRVLFEHFRWRLPASERFASDLGRLDLITHPGLREFTQAALAAPIPVLLGGHSLVTGGLWALIDAGIRRVKY